MSTSLQLHLNVTNKEQQKRAWAFAKLQASKLTQRKRRPAARYSVITAVSKEAKLLGVRAGMRYHEAKLLVPEIKILVIGGGNV